MSLPAGLAAESDWSWVPETIKRAFEEGKKVGALAKP